MINKYYAAVPLCAIAIVSFSFVKKSKPSAKKSVSLVFPVTGKKSKVESFWGSARDGGDRSHEGIDIFAKKGTPVVAVADGEILSKNTTTLGGKVIWLQPKGEVWQAYYAHLDKQLVKTGDKVRKGQVIGTVGNTGNARTTDAHLHFGIYTWEGAVNPYPMVKNAPKITSPVLPNNQQELVAKTHTKDKAVEKITGRSKEKKQSLARNNSQQHTKQIRRRSPRYYVINVKGNRYQVAGRLKKMFIDKRGFVCRISN